jgi:predicted GIY-YIG superfamily endonuclease
MTTVSTKSDQSPLKSDIVCYMLTNENLKLTYIGYSTHLKRRIRQHRGYIKGGAKYTKRFNRCDILIYLTGFPNKNIAMSYEWWSKRRRIRKHKHLTTTNTSLTWPHRRVYTFLTPLMIPKFKFILPRLKLYLSKKHFPQENAKEFCDVIRRYYSLQKVTIINMDQLPTRTSINTQHSIII